MEKARDIKKDGTETQPLSLLEGDQCLAHVYYSNGERLSATIDRVVQEAAVGVSISNERDRLARILRESIQLIESWKQQQPSIVQVQSVFVSTKIRVLVVTKGEHFDEQVSDSLESLTSAIHQRVADTPFRFRFYLEPESCAIAAARTFLSEPDITHDEAELCNS